MVNISKQYANSGHATAFSGLQRITNYYKKRVPKKVIKSELEGLRSYTLHRKRNRPKHFNPFFADTKRAQVQMDLIDVSKYWQRNGGTRFLCVGIDTFTKKAAAVAQKNKTAESTLASVKQIFHHDLAPPPKTVIFDEGKEFNNELMLKYLMKLGVKSLNPMGTHKAAVAERFNRSLQDLLYQFLTENSTQRYIDALPALLHTYNSRYHRTIKMSPNEGEKEHNHHKIRMAANEKLAKVLLAKKKPSLSVGDTVRLKVKKFSFTRGYHRRFSDNLYKIEAVETHMPVIMYTIRHIATKQLIRGGYYENELQQFRP